MKRFLFLLLVCLLVGANTLVHAQLSTKENPISFSFSIDSLKLRTKQPTSHRGSEGLVYTQASEVDRLQKLYAGTVCSLEVLGISKVETPSSDTSATFDLQGRCINGEPKRGLYIRNGKKVIK